MPAPAKPERQSLRPFEQREIYDQYVKDSVSWRQLDEWSESVAEHYGVSPAKIRFYVGRGAEMARMEREAIAFNENQKIALQIGASVAQASETLRRNLDAHTVRVVTTPSGRVTAQIEIPDASVQVRAAEALLKLHGAFADNVNVVVKNQDDPENLSDDQIEQELRAIQERRAGREG